MVLGCGGGCCGLVLGRSKSGNAWGGGGGGGRLKDISKYKGGVIDTKKNQPKTPFNRT